MGFGGSSGIFIDGFTLQRSHSCSDRTRVYGDDLLSIREKVHTHQMGNVLSKSQSKSDMNETLSKNCENMKQEVLHLEKLLEIQTKLRHALESCLGYNSSSEDFIDTNSLPEPAAELIEDVVELKLEVRQLEKYLSSLYLKAFYQKLPSSFPSTKSCSSQLEVPSQLDNVSIISKDVTDSKISYSINDRNLQRRSSLSKPLAFIDTKASLTKLVQNTSGVSLAKRLGTRIGDLLPETPNRLSEKMVKCIAAVYCKLSNPPITQRGLSSRNSNSSSSSLDHSNQWSPALSFDEEEEEDVKQDNLYNIEGLLESNGPYSTLVEVSSIFRDDERLAEVELLLQDYKSMISRLEEVDPRKLTHEEKITFWINIHNSLAMNAFVAFGIPQNNLKRAMYLHKAAYNIGGHSVNADKIQSSILKCRMSHHRRWVKKLFPSRSTFKSGDEIQAYAIDIPEPLIYFTLSIGCYSDPAVLHAFTPTDIYHQLETAKNEYIRASFGLVRNRKILLPKLVESYSRGCNISYDKVLKTILESFPESFRNRVKKCLSNRKSPATIEWVPHNFSFRYLISMELAKYSVISKAPDL